MKRIAQVGDTRAQFQTKYVNDKWLILDKYKYLFTNTHMICIYTHTRYKIFLGVLKRSAQMEESLELSTRTCLPSIWEVRSDF